MSKNELISKLVDLHNRDPKQWFTARDLGATLTELFDLAGRKGVLQKRRQVFQGFYEFKLKQKPEQNVNSVRVPLN